MDYPSTLLALSGVWLLAVIAPGPDFAATVHTALSRSRSDGIYVALGITVGMICWSGATLFGLTVLFQQWPWVYSGIRAVGAAYLLVLGVSILSGTGQAAFSRSAAKSEQALPGSAFMRGLLTNLGNPKAAFFFWKPHCRDAACGQSLVGAGIKRFDPGGDSLRLVYAGGPGVFLAPCRKPVPRPAANHRPPLRRGIFVSWRQIRRK